MPSFDIFCEQTAAGEGPASGAASAHPSRAGCGASELFGRPRSRSPAQISKRIIQGNLLIIN